MKPWEKYQEDVAALFRSLGLQAATNVSIPGIRTSHDVDVVVEFETAGMGNIWLVECKYWKRNIPKDRPLLLRQIVQDIGADKGIIVSEVGFQSGSHEAVQMSNVIVTSLSDLRRITQEDVFDVGISSLQLRVEAAVERFSQLSVRSGPRREVLPMVPSVVQTTGSSLEIRGQLAILSAAIDRASKREFPVTYEILRDGSRLRSSREDFLSKADETLQSLEMIVATLWRP